MAGGGDGVLFGDDDLGRAAIVGRYKLLRVLGEGGGGRVYEAVHVDLKKPVALKILSRSLAGKPEIVARFLREGELATRIRHAHVVDVTDFGLHEERPYLVMELLAGEDLMRHLQRAGPLDTEPIAEIMLPVIAAVAAAHREGVIHRDLKPANVFLSKTRDGRVVPKLLDFGISKVSGDYAGDLTKTASMLGTPQYMSPEQIKDSKNIDARADQYSLGVILYQLSTNRLPFVQEDVFSLIHAIVNEPFPPPSRFRADLPKAFEAVVLRAMARDREARFPDVDALGVALADFARGDAKAAWRHIFLHPELRTPAIVASNVTPSERVSAEILVAKTQEAQPSTDVTFSPATRTTGSRRSAFIGIALAAVLAAGAVVFLTTRSTTPPSTTTQGKASSTSTPTSTNPATSVATTQEAETAPAATSTTIAPASTIASNEPTASASATHPSLKLPASTVAKKPAPSGAQPTATATAPAASVLKGTNGATIIPD